MPTSVAGYNWRDTPITQPKQRTGSYSLPFSGDIDCVFHSNLPFLRPAKSPFYPLTPSHSTSAFVCLWGGIRPDEH